MKKNIESFSKFFASLYSASKKAFTNSPLKKEFVMTRIRDDTINFDKLPEYRKANTNTLMDAITK